MTDNRIYDYSDCDDEDKMNFLDFIEEVTSIYLDLKNFENDTNEMEWYDNKILKLIPLEYIQYQRLSKDNEEDTVELMEIVDDLYDNSNYHSLKYDILNAIEDKLNELKKMYHSLGTDPSTTDPNVFNGLISMQLINIHKKLSERCNVSPVLLKEFFDGTKLDHANSSDVVTIDFGDDYEEKYYETIRIIKHEIKKYADFDISYIIDQVETYFQNEKLYKLGKFVKVKEDLIKRLNEKFNSLVEKNTKKIKKNLKIEIMTDYMNECLSYTYHDKLYKLYKLFVLYPLLNIDINYEKNDYVEADANKNNDERKKLLGMIIKTRKQYEKVKSLK